MRPGRNWQPQIYGLTRGRVLRRQRAAARESVRHTDMGRGESDGAALHREPRVRLLCIRSIGEADHYRDGRTVCTSANASCGLFLFDYGAEDVADSLRSN